MLNASENPSDQILKYTLKQTTTQAVVLQELTISLKKQNKTESA